MTSIMTSQLSTLYASMASCSELLTRRTYYIQCIGPSGDLVKCSGTLNYPPTIPTNTNIASLAWPDRFFSPRHLSIRNYKRLLEKGSGTLPIGLLCSHFIQQQYIVDHFVSFLCHLHLSRLCCSIMHLSIASPTSPTWG